MPLENGRTGNEYRYTYSSYTARIIISRLIDKNSKLV